MEIAVLVLGMVILMVKRSPAKSTNEL